MSILIKGMEMPNDCIDCFAETYNECMATGKIVNSLGRPDWCPLVEVPKHGRLIEADKLMDKIRRYGGGGLWSEEELYFTVKDMPTIIEAEE